MKIGKTSLYACLVVAGCISCSKDKQTLFSEELAEKTNITFANTVVEDEENNVLAYPYYFNGGGVAVGDINNDGLVDIYFSGNQVPNKLYLNKGNFQFEDVTEGSGIAAAEGWKTGVTMADVNQDGWLDIYVCRSAMSDSTLRTNLLFINQKNLTFKEAAASYGIDDNSYSSHGGFFDYDLDGDLDLFVLNHSLPQYAGFSNLLVSRKKEKGNKFGSKLFRNDGGTFTDVSEESGIINNVLSFGLGLAISDVNHDGWPDLYISNDFNEEDYLYLNNKNGTFKNVVREAMGHVSLFSMGSDVGDINNDGLSDILTLDMLPESNERIKLSSGDDNYDKYKLLIESGFHHQSMRNMLQLNNGDGTFSEIGQLAGVSNTDWSWAPLFADFDGDGWKDLFVTNGYEKDYTNMQFLKFTMDEQIKARQKGAGLDYNKILENIPSIEVGNYLFRNNGDLTFTKSSADWGLSRTFKSNGAAYCDLDNDGDPDLVINAMNEPAILYRNNSVERDKATYLSVDLQKNNLGRNIIGTKVYIYTDSLMQYMEFSPSRGFQSSMFAPMNVGLNGAENADSVRIVWPDNRIQSFSNISCRSVFAPAYSPDGAIFHHVEPADGLFSSADIIAWQQSPPEINDFKRQFMLPRMYSYTGPRMAHGDVNGDGLIDIYVCGPRLQRGGLFIQQENGKLVQSQISAFDADKAHQDEDAVFFDFDNDHDLDLYVVSGGYSLNENDPLLQDRLYINDGSGRFTKAEGVLPPEFLAGSCVEVLDVNGDNHLDIFVGSRLIPGKYPLKPQSMLLVNDGAGRYTDRIAEVAPELADIGMVCDAVVTDLNNDQVNDLVVVGEWTSIGIFINSGKTLSDQTTSWHANSTLGLWNCVVSEDFDGDGDQDLIVGNYGLNNQFAVSEKTPATLIYKDFNQDGEVDAFMNYYIGGKSYPFASRDEALGQVTSLKVKFPDYVSYSNATMETIFTKEELENTHTLRADLLQTVYLENKGGHFEMKNLPVQAQFAPVYALATYDVDQDGDLDLVCAGNETRVRVRIGKTDANKGFVFLNDGRGEFTYAPQYHSGLNIEGDVRSLLFVPTRKGARLLAGAIEEPIRSYKLNATDESQSQLMAHP